jgi:hypothetical protein
VIDHAALVIAEENSVPPTLDDSIKPVEFLLRIADNLRKWLAKVLKFTTTALGSTPNALALRRQEVATPVSMVADACPSTIAWTRST